AGFWSASWSDVPGYNLYYDLYEFSRLTGKPHLQVALWRDGLELSQSSPDTAQRAMAHSLMGSAAEMAGDPQAAEKEFAIASQIFAGSPQIDSTRIALVEAETRLAGVEANNGKASRAA